MSRHRNVRSMNYEDEYDGYDDVYGHSVEENEFCVSPATASQFLYDRGANQNLSSFMDDEKIPEEDEANINSEEESNPLQDSSQFKKPQLSDVDEAKLNSCLEEIRNIVGESTPEHVMIEAILGANFDYHKALDMILNQKEIPKPQRQPRVRKDRDYEELNSFSLSFSPENFISAHTHNVNIFSNNSPQGVQNFSPNVLSGAGKEDQSNVLHNIGHVTVPSNKPMQHDSIFSSLKGGLSKSNVNTKGKPKGISLADLAKEHKGESTQGDMPVLKAKKDTSIKGGRPKIKPVHLSLADLAKQNSVPQPQSVKESSCKCGKTTGGLSSCVECKLKAGWHPVKDSPLSDYKLSFGDKLNKSKSSKPISLAELAKSHNVDKAAQNKMYTQPNQESPQEILNTNCQQITLSDITNCNVINSSNIKSTKPPPGFGPFDLSALAESHKTLFKHVANSASSKLIEDRDCGSSVLTRDASLFANALCTRLNKKVVRQKGQNCTRFSYHHQRKTNDSKKLVDHPNEQVVKPFDFTTPSPDDIVKEKQKGAFLRTGGRGVSTIAQAPDLTITPMIRTSEPAVDEPTPVISTGVARMTFTTGTKTKSGFTPEKTGDTDNFNTGEVDSVKSDLQKRLAGNGDGAENEAPSKTLLSTPKKSALSLAEESGSVPSTPKSAVKPKRDPAEVKKQYEKRKNCGKEFLNLVVIGHVDAGKSTLMGHVLYQLGCVDSRVMHKYEKEAQKMGKASFAFAWVLDETDEERSRGVTMDVAQTRFETDSKIVTLLDAPGHKDFIPNMITGAAQADVGILVVNATKGEFETGFDAGGQTREHAMLVRSLGVSQIIVAVNKMDTVDWAEERYKEIRKKLGNFLKQAGFKDSDVDYVPCSGLSGENLTKNATQAGLKKWYSGPCLTKLIDGLRPPVRQYDQPFRMCITDVFKPMGSGISTCGTLQAGCVAAGDKVLVMPLLEVANIKAVSVDEAPAEFAFAGDNATVTLTNIDMANLYVGSILCDPSAPIPVTSRIQARIVIFNIDLPITKGFPVVFHYQSLSEPAVIKKLVSQLNRSTGEVTRKKPRCLTRNSSAVIEIELDRPICIELYKDFKDLGRFMLRYSGSTIAAGLVTEILSTKPTKTE